MLGTFVNGFVVGLLASIPLGPIGVLCVQRTITKKFRSGYASALGAATADTIFAAIALFSLSIVMPYVETHMRIITLIGGLIIVAMGVKIFFTKYSPNQIKHNRQRKLSLLKDYFSVLLLTISNPVYILVLLGLFASTKIDGQHLTVFGHMSVISGVFIGAASWWFVLTFSVNLLRKKFRARHIQIINWVAGVVIVVFGLYALIYSLLN